MYRLAMDKLYKWKDSENRRPLIIDGARQVGKTWLVKEFGRLAYKDTAYISFDSNTRMAELFSSELNTDRLIMGLELYIGKKISPENTLIVFDEVQEIPRALSSLKYFCEDAPQYHIICAGSFGKSALHNEDSLPSDKAERIRLYPLSYREFLTATGNEHLAELLDSLDFQMITDFRQAYTDTLKQYLFIGGMPEAVLRFSENKDWDEVREVHRRILNAYEQDFYRHAPAEIVPKLRMVWNSIPAQLAKENKKFIYGMLREGARAKDHEAAITWLTDRGLLHKLCRVTDPRPPLKEYADIKTFKLFMADVGLLGCMAGLRPDILLDGNRVFEEYGGALTEQYVMQQLAALSGLDIYYYTNERSSCEIDFVVDNGKHIVPVEVMTKINLKSKSLKMYREKYSPRLCIRAAMTDYRVEEGLIYLPLYVIEKLN